MTQLTVEESFQIAVQRHQAGQLPQAEQLYREVLAREPNHPEASHNLGLLAHQTGRNDVALELLRRATSVKPSGPQGWNSLGEVLRIVGQFDESIAAFRRAIALEPAFAIAHHNLGNALRSNGRLDEAIAAYRQTIAVNPGYLKAYGSLGSALQEKGQLEEAITCFRRAIALKGDSAEAYCSLGGALKDKGQFDEAIAAYRQAIALDPNSPILYNNLGVALKAKGQVEEGIAACRHAVDLKPDLHLTHLNLANCLVEAGKLDEAMACSRKAIALKPDFAEAHVNLAFSLLLSGELSRGWVEYEWRWKCRSFASAQRNFPRPLWDGQPLKGATLLLHAEQSVGDTLQFVRYLPLAAQKGGKVILECPAELQRLLRTMAGDCRVVARGEPLGAFDAHCPLVSLPRVFGTTLENIPNQVPYIRADVELSRKWRARMAGDVNTVKVGLAWGDSRTRESDRNRSMPLSALSPLGQLPGFSFYSIQKRDPADQLVPEGLKLIDWTGEFADFADTAAFIANLDFVIAADTAVVHLAGAMGKRVGVMLPFVPDWRWLLKRKDSPWYPSMRLFRQPAMGDWDSVTKQVTEVLRALRDKRSNPAAKTK